MDDLGKRKPPDNKRINVREAQEARYWTQALGVTELQLRNAIQGVGTSVDKVRERVEEMKRESAPQARRGS